MPWEEKLAPLGRKDADGWAQSRGAAAAAVLESNVWKPLARINPLIVGTCIAHNDSLSVDEG